MATSVLSTLVTDLLALLSANTTLLYVILLILAILTLVMLILDSVLALTLLATVEILALLEDVLLPMDKLLANLPLPNVLETYVTHLLAILLLDNAKLYQLLYVTTTMLVLEILAVPLVVVSMNLSLVTMIMLVPKILVTL